jgi:hypothetical protein
LALVVVEWVKQVVVEALEDTHTQLLHCYQLELLQ